MNFFGNNNISSDNHKSLLDQFPRKYSLQRCIQVLTGVALGAASSFAFGLGLGEIEPKSFLGQPLAASIELVSLDGDIDPESLIVRQVTRIEAEKMGVDIFHSGYHFDMNIDYSTGRPTVTVVSKKSINEPYLNLLVELRWPSGVVYREYPILLDPPPLVPVSSLESKRPASNAIANKVASKPASSKSSKPNVRSGGADNTSTTKAKPLSTAKGDSYKVKSGDTLWQISKDLSEGSSLSIKETMAWVHKNNPSAFSSGDMNRLKAGARLKMPDMSSLRLEDRLLPVPARALTESENAAPLEPVSAQETNRELEIEETKTLNVIDQPEHGLLVVNSDQTDDQSRELIDMLTRENEDLKARMSKVENSEYLDTLKKLVSLQKRQISELRAKLGVKDTSSEEISALLEQADVDVDSPVNTQASSNIEEELSSIEKSLDDNQVESTTDVAVSEPTAEADEVSLVDVAPPLANPPKATADKSLVTWLVVGAGAFLAMVFAFLLIYYRKMATSRNEDEYDDADDYTESDSTFAMGKSHHSGRFLSSTEADDIVVQERAPDIGYDGELSDGYEVEEDGDWLGEKVEDVENFDAGAFDSAIQEVEDIFESISLDEKALGALDEAAGGAKAKLAKGRSEDEVRTSIAEKMSQYNPRDFRTSSDSFGMLEIDEVQDELEESDEVDATINRAKMFCEFSQFIRAKELILKSMGELPDSRYTEALEYIEDKKTSAEAQGEDETKVEGFNASLDDAPSDMLEESFVGDFSENTLDDEDSTEITSLNASEKASVLMDKFEGDLDDGLAEDSTEFSASFDLDDDSTEVLSEGDNVAEDLLDDALAAGMIEDSLDLDLDIDFDDVDFDDDIQIDDSGIEGKKKPVSC